MTKYLYIVFVVLSILFASCSKEMKHNPQFSSLGIEMVAHKGVHLDSIAPPNSLDAIVLAYRAGFKMVELDLNKTQDETIILLHDNHLNETLSLRDGYQPIDTFVFCMNEPWQELRDNYVFTSPNVSMRRSLATLTEALLLCKKLNLFPYLEFKEHAFIHNLYLVDKVILEAQKILGKNNFVVTSWNLDIAEYARRQYPDLVVMCDPIQVPELLRKHKLSYFPDWERIDAAIVDEQHSKGYIVSTWTVDKLGFDSISELHVDKILTDNIAPAFEGAKAIFNNYSDSQFSKYTTTGVLDEGVIKLNKGEAIELKPLGIDSIPFGAIHFSVDMKGKLAIESTDFNVERRTKGNDYKLFRFQYMIVSKAPSFKLIALEDNTIVKSLWFAVLEY